MNNLNVADWLIKIGRHLRNRCINLIAIFLNYSSEQIENKFGRMCRGCYKRFVPRFTHHYLCIECEEVYIKCWNQECRNYFKPEGGRYSETYCSSCRKAGQAFDLLEELSKY